MQEMNLFDKFFKGFKEAQEEKENSLRIKLIDMENMLYDLEQRADDIIHLDEGFRQYLIDNEEKSVHNTYKYVLEFVNGYADVSVKVAKFRQDIKDEMVEDNSKVPYSDQLCLEVFRVYAIYAKIFNNLEECRNEYRRLLEENS